MATLSTVASTRSSNRGAAANSAPKGDENAIRGFRVTGMVSDFFHGTTKPAAGKSAQPYVRFKIDGTTPTGKTIQKTVMGFGEKAIEWLDVSAKTREAGIFVTFDRNGKNSNVLVPMGPYRAQSSYEG